MFVFCKQKKSFKSASQFEWHWNFFLFVVFILGKKIISSSWIIFKDQAIHSVKEHFLHKINNLERSADFEACLYSFLFCSVFIILTTTNILYIF